MSSKIIFFFLVYILFKNSIISCKNITSLTNTETNSITKFGLNGKSNGSNIATFTLQMPVTLASNIPPTTLVLRAGAQNNASFKIINIQAQLAVQ